MSESSETKNGVLQTWRSKILNISIRTRYGEVLILNVIVALFYHAVALDAIFRLPSAKWQTLVLMFVTIFGTMLGITAGAHRLWAHRSYKAALPLRILLVFLNTMAIQRDIRWWARDHRTHHKFVDTNADPYNAKRGFFFSHVGWLLVKKHPDVIEKGRKVDISDLEADPVVMFQYRYYDRLAIIFGFILPTVVPVYFWNETVVLAFGSTILRYVYTLHGTFSVNSFAHMFGSQPYDKSFTPKENSVVSFITFGEGYHNFHHSFPSDYATSELGFKFNASKYFIKSMASLGLAYDLKTVSPELVRKRALRTG